MRKSGIFSDGWIFLYHICTVMYRCAKRRQCCQVPTSLHCQRHCNTVNPRLLGELPRPPTGNSGPTLMFADFQQCFECSQILLNYCTYVTLLNCIC